MASRMFHDWQHGQQGLVKIEGSFAPNGSSALSAASTKGKGFTVARTSAGLFTVTLANAYMELIAAQVSLQRSAASPIQLELGTADVVTAKTVQIRAVDMTDPAVPAVADVAANAANRIHFSLTLRNTAVA